MALHHAHCNQYACQALGSSQRLLSAFLMIKTSAAARWRAPRTARWTSTASCTPQASTQPAGSSSTCGALSAASSSCPSTPLRPAWLPSCSSGPPTYPLGHWLPGSTSRPLQVGVACVLLSIGHWMRHGKSILTYTIPYARKGRHGGHWLLIQCEVDL